MSEPADIVRVALETMSTATGRTRDLDGLRVVVSAGGTREPLDPVRFLGNRSSGKQGVAVARAAAARGARVTLVAAHLDTDVAAAAHGLSGVEVVDVGTAEELGAAVRHHGAGADIVVMAAAVADYRPVRVSESKIKKDDSGDGLTLELERTPDVLAALSADAVPGRTIVGFAAETATDRDGLLELGRAKMARKGADLLVLNAVGWTVGFGADDNAAILIGRGGDVVAEASGAKDAVADALLDAVLSLRSR